MIWNIEDLRPIGFDHQLEIKIFGVNQIGYNQYFFELKDFDFQSVKDYKYFDYSLNNKLSFPSSHNHDSCFHPYECHQILNSLSL